MLVAGTLETDQELIENVATVMQGARVAARGAEEDPDDDGVQLQVSLSGRDVGPETPPERPEARTPAEPE